MPNGPRGLHGENPPPAPDSIVTIPASWHSAMSRRIHPRSRTTCNPPKRHRSRFAGFSTRLPCSARTSSAGTTLPTTRWCSRRKVRNACAALAEAVSALKQILQISVEAGGGPVPVIVQDRLDDADEKVAMASDPVGRRNRHQARPGRGEPRPYRAVEARDAWPQAMTRCRVVSRSPARRRTACAATVARRAESPSTRRSPGGARRRAEARRTHALLPPRGDRLLAERRALRRRRLPTQRT